MVINNNSLLTKELIEGGKLQIIEGVPQRIADIIQPVMEVNPKLLRYCNVVKNGIVTNGTTATIYTTPTTQDFYLVAMQMSLIKDATSTSTSSTIGVFIDGFNLFMMRIPGITLTPQNQTQTLSLPFPIKIDRGTIINVTTSSATATIICNATIFGFVVENSNA